MKAHWFYYVVKYSSWIGLKLFFGSIKIHGKEKLPTDGALIYAPNHQGAFMDAMLAGTYTREPVSFLTRADIFKKWTEPFLRSLNMMPIYRMRDGVNSITQNEQVFENCFKMLSEGESILIFPEGNHNNKYFLRPLKKGIARMSMNAQEKIGANHKIYIVPTGINYFSHYRPLAKAHIHYGEAIEVNKYMDLFRENEQKAFIHFLDELEAAMKSTLIIPEETEDYDKKVNYIFQPKHQDLPLDELKKMGRSKPPEEVKDRKPNLISRLFIFLFSIPNCVPLLILRKLLSGIKDHVFYISLKFLIGGILHIFWWFILFGIGAVWLSWEAGLQFALTAIIMMYARQALIRY